MRHTVFILYKQETVFKKKYEKKVSFQTYEKLCKTKNFFSYTRPSD